MKFSRIIFWVIAICAGIVMAGCSSNENVESQLVSSNVVFGDQLLGTVSVRFRSDSELSKDQNLAQESVHYFIEQLKIPMTMKKEEDVALAVYSYMKHTRGVEQVRLKYSEGEEFIYRFDEPGQLQQVPASAL